MHRKTILFATICACIVTATTYNDPIVRRITRNSESGSLSGIRSANSLVQSDYASGRGHHENHKPVFVNCSTYHPSVKEEERGSFVIQVRAKDYDKGDVITYKFITGQGERQKFTIDPATGVILCQHAFDRDEPARDKEAYIIVQATDNGVPPLSDVCTIKVSIEDVNDNQPVFDKVSYSEFMSKDLRVNDEVMRVSATDIDDGNNSIISYKLSSRNTFDSNYFRIDESSGVIYLNQPIVQAPNYMFHMKAIATDHGTEPKYSEIDIDITVVDSDKKAPTFISRPLDPIYKPENFTFFVGSYEEPIATVRAQSNVVNSSDVLFQLVTGRTEQTNKQNTFVLESNKDTAYIKLAKNLDYEAITEYTLTVRVQNTYALAAETTIVIRVEDVNDNIPVFTELVSGSVPENEPIGTPVMQVRAVDADGTVANNVVSYALEDHQDLFAIDPNTGNITTMQKFDRETTSVYNVKVIGRDNSPSSLYNNGEPNKGEQVFRIVISDKNDNKPEFTQQMYFAEAVPENANLNTLVTEVTALDNDTASPVMYTIVDGNINHAFKIETLTGKIRVNSILDYEKITKYMLRVRASDGVWDDECDVEIRISNVNDNPPFLINNSNSTTIEEEKVYYDCIETFEAYDPDIEDRSAPQGIEYFLPEESQREYFTIDKTGCLRVIKPLDGDPPFTPKRQIIIVLADEGGTQQTTLKTTVVFTVYLQDINDNAPFLDMDKPVVWPENSEAGPIVVLKAKDIDSAENGAPFFYRIADSADDEIKLKFTIEGNTLSANVVFDREEKKYYFLPIEITDNGTPPQSGISILKVTIGDENDNAMQPGTSDIFVYDYKGALRNVDIGRVYVDDPDDWDLQYKSFFWKSGSGHPYFDLDSSTGVITLRHRGDQTYYVLEFGVTEEAPLIPRHTVEATVYVTIKVIPEEAVDKSGSIRFFNTTPEEFIEESIVYNGKRKSKRDMLQSELSKIFNVSSGNVDVMTVLHSDLVADERLVDVRFSVHGSPYYYPEKLSAFVDRYQNTIEERLQLKMMMIGINECMLENVHCNNSDSCVSYLHKRDTPYVVYTNRTSFVGVNAMVDVLCECRLPINTLDCLNNGTLLSNGSCSCRPGFQGPRCEAVSASFNGDGWALYPPLEACGSLNISFDIKAYRSAGLVLYQGPLKYNPLLPVKDFIALELRNGYPVLLVDYGTGTVEMRHNHIKITDGKLHNIRISLSRSSVGIIVDNCLTSTCYESSVKDPVGKNRFLNVNAPLQLGGSMNSFDLVASALNWSYSPTNIGFSGCISNFTVNDALTYELGNPRYSMHMHSSCNLPADAAGVSLGLHSNFMLAIILCILLLLIILLGVVVLKRHRNPYLEKDTDDIRENIINYEDEGGGEVDTNYDLNVFPKVIYKDMIFPAKQEKTSPRQDAQNISEFLEGRKDNCDRDPDTSPFDDVRHYAYEGDGNSTGSLSSLASCTDDGDLKFNYLEAFGPRFRKLADMYGSEDDSQEEREESWC